MIMKAKLNDLIKRLETIELEQDEILEQIHEIREEENKAQKSITKPKDKDNSKIGDRGLEQGITQGSVWSRVYDRFQRPDLVRAVTGNVTKLLGTYES